MVRWPKKNTLCFPVFLDQGKQLTQENEGDGEHTEPATAPHKHLGTETQPPQERDDSVSVSPLSSLSSESQQEDTPIAAPSAPQTDSDREEEKEMGDSALLSETANVLLHSGPLVRGDLPEDKESLQNLKIQTEMELMWLRQAIDSRRKVSLLIYCWSIYCRTSK